MAEKIHQPEKRISEHKVSISYSTAEVVKAWAARRGVSPSAQLARFAEIWRRGHPAVLLGVDLSFLDSKTKKPRVLNEKQPFLNISDRAWEGLNLTANDKDKSVKEIIENIIDDWAVGHEERITSVDDLIKKIRSAE